MGNPNHDDHGRFSSGGSAQHGIQASHLANHEQNVKAPLDQARASLMRVVSHSTYMTHPRDIAQKFGIKQSEAKRLLEERVKSGDLEHGPLGHYNPARL